MVQYFHFSVKYSLEMFIIANTITLKTVMNLIYDFDNLAILVEV